MIPRYEGKVRGFSTLDRLHIQHREDQEQMEQLALWSYVKWTGRCEGYMNGWFCCLKYLGGRAFGSFSFCVGAVLGGAVVGTMVHWVLT